MTDDDITKLCRTKSLVKQREIVENLVQAIASSDTFCNSVQGINIALSPLNVVGNTFEDSIFSWPFLGKNKIDLCTNIFPVIGTV